MLLPWVALVLAGSALQAYPPVNVYPIPNEPSTAITAESTQTHISSAELQVLRIRVLQLTTPPVLPAVDKLPGAPVPGALKPVMPLMPPKAAVPYPSRKIWIGLAAGEHAAAIFDAWTTRRSLETGHTQELNPLVKPFSQSAAVYPALQVLPTASDFFSRMMMHSSHPLFRRTWWLPQTVGMAASILSGVHNLQYTH